MARGGSVAEREGLMDRLTVIEGTLGKAFGVMGGYITGVKSLVRFHVNSFASGFIFTTALPPALAAGAIAYSTFERKPFRARNAKDTRRGSARKT